MGSICLRFAQERSGAGIACSSDMQAEATEEGVKLARRLSKIQKLCEDFDKALGSRDEHRAILARIKADADAALKPCPTKKS